MRGAPFSWPPGGGGQYPLGGRSSPVTVPHGGRRPRSGQLRPEVVLLGWRRASFSSPEQYLTGCGSPHTSRVGPTADPGPAAPSPATPPHLAAVPSQHNVRRAAASMPRSALAMGSVFCAVHSRCKRSPRRLSVHISVIFLFNHHICSVSGILSNASEQSARSKSRLGVPFCGCCYQHFIHADPDIGSTFNCSIFKVRSPFLCFK